MNKKYKYIIICISILLVLGIVLLIINNKRDTNIVNNDKNTNSGTKSNNSLVLYFSVTNNTEKVAEYIKDITNSDIIEIIPVDKYSNADINYSNRDSRATKEQNNAKARPKISNKIEIDKYEIIYLGYPIWWGDVPKIILTLFDKYNFENKTIIPFCTSGSTDIANSVETLRNYNDKLNILDGKRFNANTSSDEVKNWLDSISVNND